MKYQFIFCCDFAVAVLLAFNAPLTALPPLPNDFPHYKEIHFNVTSSTTELAAVRLDDNVYAHTSNLTGGLQVFRSDGSVVAHLRNIASEKQRRSRRESWAPEHVDLQKLPDGGLLFTLTTKPDRPVDGIHIDTPLTDFYQHVTVHGQLPGGEWQEIVPNAVIYDLSRHFAFRASDIPLPANNYLAFRVVIHEPTSDVPMERQQITETRTAGGIDSTTLTRSVQQRPFQVGRFALWKNVSEPHDDKPIVQEYRTQGFRAEPSTHERRVTYYFSTDNQPLTEVSILTDQTNFSRDVTLESQVETSTGTTWQLVARDRLQAVSFRELHRSHLRLEFTETRGRNWRISVEHGDNAPLTLSGVKAAGHVHELQFLHESGTQYRLYYGAVDFLSAALDTSALRTISERGYVPAMVTLGEQLSNTDHHPRNRHTNAIEIPQIVFWIAGLILTIVTVLGLVAAVGRVESNPSPEKPSDPL